MSQEDEIHYLLASESARYPDCFDGCRFDCEVVGGENPCTCLEVSLPEEYDNASWWRRMLRRITRSTRR